MQYTSGLWPRSVGNSASILGWPQTQVNWVRPGIMLYGSSPFVMVMPDVWLAAGHDVGSTADFHPYHPKGEHRLWRKLSVPEDTRTGGLPWLWLATHALTGTPVWINGETRILGRVPDMIVIDRRRLKPAW